MKLILFKHCPDPPYIWHMTVRLQMYCIELIFSDYEYYLLSISYDHNCKQKQVLPCLQMIYCIPKISNNINFPFLKPYFENFTKVIYLHFSLIWMTTNSNVWESTKSTHILMQDICKNIICQLTITATMKLIAEHVFISHCHAIKTCKM